MSGAELDTNATQKTRPRPITAENEVMANASTNDIHTVYTTVKSCALACSLSIRAWSVISNRVSLQDRHVTRSYY